MEAQIFGTPRIVTYSELVRKLTPYIRGYTWAENTIRDLWSLCTPTPDQVLDPNNIANEKRILHPNQFAAWWNDVCQRQGIDMSADQAVPVVRTH
jgi:hypothetical protein